MNRRPGILFWLGLISILIILAAYYQGVVADSKAVFPFFIQLGELAQGRNPYTGTFAAYPTGGNGT